MIETLIIVFSMLFLALIIEEKFSIPSPMILIISAFIFSRYGNSTLLSFKEEEVVEGILFLLPILILSDTMVLKVKDLKENLFNLIYLAFISIVISVILGVVILNTVFIEYEMSIPAMIILFSMLLATDPVSVITIFNKFTLPHKLKVLAEGEALFNDAMALIIFYAVGMYMLNGNDITFSYLSMISIEIILFSIGIGFSIGILFSLLYPYIYEFKNSTIELLFLVVVAYVSFYISEHIIIGNGNHLSGILSEIITIITIKVIMEKNIKRGLKKIDNENYALEKLIENHKPTKIKATTKLLKLLKYNIEKNEKHTQIFMNIKFLAVLANAILFISMASLINLDLLLKYSYEIFMIFLVTTLIRGLMMLKFSFISKLNGVEIQWHWWSILVLAGIKGGISIVMCHMIPNTFFYKEMFQAIVIGVILLSTFLNTFGLFLVIYLKKETLKNEANNELDEDNNEFQANGF